LKIIFPVRIKSDIQGRRATQKVAQQFRHAVLLLNAKLSDTFNGTVLVRVELGSPT